MVRSVRWRTFSADFSSLNRPLPTATLALTSGLAQSMTTAWAPRPIAGLRSSITRSQPIQADRTQSIMWGFLP
jgi:hypothetical protein